jgi:pimeloyl-ACP methyl ester carboxylesterase
MTTTTTTTTTTTPTTTTTATPIASETAGETAPAAGFTAQDFHRERRFVDTELGRVAYVERGRGPAALFIHGALLNGYQWRHQLAGLADVRRVIALDSPGLGYSHPHPGRTLAGGDQAVMVRGFLAALDIGRVDLVGNDSGGGIAQVFAAENPGAVRSLALTNCEVDDFDDQGPAFVRLRQSLRSGALVKAMRAALRDPAVAKKVLGTAYQRFDALPTDAIPTYFSPLVESPARAESLLAYFAGNPRAELVAARPALKQLAAPILVLWGTGDVFFPLSLAHWLRANLPSVTEVVEIPGAPVFWPEERPDFLNRKLREHWTRAGSH